ncbi:MAG: PAS domain S-box protein [Armatimonadota bacterium]
MEQLTRLANLASRAPMPILGIDRDGRVTYVNDSVCAVTGYAREELIGGFIWDHMVLSDGERLRERFLSLRDEGVDGRLDARTPTRAGAELLIAWHNVSFFDDDGRLEAVLSIGADITALRGAERRLARVNTVLQALSGISGLALRADDPRDLLDQVAEVLVNSRACTEAWIARVGDDGRPVGLVGSWPGRATSPDALQSAAPELPACISEALNGAGQLALNEIAEACTECFFAPDCAGVHGVATRVEHRDHLHAVLVTHVKDTDPVDDEMQRLFRGIADDLGFALAMLEARAKHERTERSLADQTRLLDAFFESSLEPTAILDRDFNFLRVNEAYARSCARPAEALIGENHFALFPDEENQRIFEQVRDTGEAFETRARAFEFPDHPEWGVTWWDWSLVPTLDDAGDVAILTLWLRDVTEEQRVRQQLEAQRNFVDAVVERAGSLVIVVDRDGRIVRFNRTCEEVSGYSAEEVLGRDFVGVLIPDEDTEQVREDFRRLLAEGLTNYENSWQREDGGLRRISWRLNTFTGEDGRMEFMIGTGWDVTEERRMARELRESEEKYRELVENAHTIIIRWDTDGTIRFMNEYGLEFFGYSEEEMVGRHVGIILPSRDTHGEDLTGLVEAIVARPEDYWVHENENIARDGTRHWVSWSNRILRDEDGETTGIMAIGVDRTAQKRAEELLEASREDLRDLTAELAMAEQRERREVATVLHDSIGQLLAFAKMKLSTMREQDGVKRSDLRDTLRYVSEAIGETRSLTNQLSPPVLQQLGLAAAVEWLVDEMSDRHGTPMVFEPHVEFEELDQEIAITAFQATRELITNAIKHSQAGQVTVRLWLKESHVSIEVADDGNGFDPATLTRRDRGKGGFGLLNVRERISYLGGTVKIDTAPGNGTSVKLICPTTAREPGIS